MTSRSKTVDVARGLGIILIVFGHSPMVLTENPELFRVVFSFHLPLFFFLSGVFLRDSDGLRHLIQKRADTLLKPYFSVLSIVGIYRVASRATPIKKYCLGVLYATGGKIESISTAYLGPLWFLPHLFVALVFSSLVLKAIKNLPQTSFLRVALYITILTVGGILIEAKGIGLPFSLDLIFVTSGFILFGNFWSKQVQSFSFRSLDFIFAGVVFLACHYFYDETIDLNQRLLGNFLICTLQSFLGIYIILSVSALFSRNKTFAQLLAYVGASSLFILIFHWVVMHAVLKFTHLSENWYLNIFAAVLAGVIIPIAFQEISKRHRILATALLPSKSSPYVNSRF